MGDGEKIRTVVDVADHFRLFSQNVVDFPVHGKKAAIIGIVFYRAKKRFARFDDIALKDFALTRIVHPRVLSKRIRIDLDQLNAPRRTDYIVQAAFTEDVWLASDNNTPTIYPIAGSENRVVHWFRFVYLTPEQNIFHYAHIAFQPIVTPEGTAAASSEWRRRSVLPML